MRTKYSRQRVLMLEELSNRCDHPTADELYVSLREKLPNISLATVYRNLGLLEKSGAIRRVISNGADHFDADMTPHHHMICDKCNTVIDVFMKEDVTVCSTAQELVKGKIDGYSLIFHGYCQHCMQADE